MRLILLRIFNVVMAFVALLALALAVGVGRLMMGPVTTTSLTPWIERALSQPRYGIEAKVNQSVFHWDVVRKQVVLDMNGVQFLDPLGQKVADIPQVLLMLSPLGYFDKAHSPWVMVIRHPQIHLRVDSKNELRLGALQAGESNVLERDEETPINSEVLREQLKGIAKQTHDSPFGLFSNFSIEDMGVTLIDEPRNQMWSFNAPLIAMKRVGRDHEGSARVHITHDKQETDLDFNIRYSNQEKLFHAVLSFKDIDPSMMTATGLPVKIEDYSTGLLGGAVTLIFNDNLDVRTGLLNLTSADGLIKAPDYFPEPLKMKRAVITAAYTSGTKMLTIEPFTIELEKAQLSGRSSVSFDSEVRTVSSQLKLAKLRLEDLPLYWPENVAVNPRAWILENMKKGLAEELTLNIDVSVPGTDFEKAKLDRLDGTISLKETQVRYWEPLPMIENASATSTFDSQHFDIDVKSGNVGSVKLKPSKVIISGLDAVDQIATVEAHLAGPAQETLRILNLPPLKYADKMKVDPGLVTGSMEGVIKTSFPLLKALLLDDMGITADVKLMDVGIKKIVDFLVITNANATLGVDVKALTISGDAVLNGIPANIRWDEKFTAVAGEPLSHGVAGATTRAESAAAFGVGFAVHSDPMPVTVVYDRYENLSKLAITADAGKAKLSIPDVWYNKAAGAPANIAITLEWGGGPPPRLSKIDLSGQALNVKGTGSFDGTGKVLNKLSLNPLVIGQTRVKLDFIKGADNIPSWTVSGESLDARGLLEPAPEPEKKDVTAEIQGKKLGEPPVGATPIRVDLQVDKLITGDKSQLGSTKVKGQRDAVGWTNLNISTVTSDQTPFNLTLGPQGGKTTLAANTPNLGNMLKALNITDTMSGGKMNMDGNTQPNDNSRTLYGKIKITDFDVREMPVLLKLLSAISPDFLIALGRQALHFGSFDSEYMWGKNMFVFTKASTSTGTLGITVAGKVDMANSRLDLEGQVIPVEFISKIIGAIPIIGDILTGGNGHGLFAATYKIRGPLEKPEVSVNPVSILAPGIIRDILFTDPNIGKLDKKPAAVPPKPATASPTTQRGR